MPRTQLAINCPAPLLERLKAAAAAQGTTVTSLVLAWVEAGLDAPRSGLDQRLDPSRPASRPAPRPDLDQRLDAVERRLDALEVPAPAKPASPNRVTAPSPARLVAAPQAGDSITTAELAELPPGGIETAALADRLGMRRGTLNARIARAGGAAPGLVLEGWRCVGQSAPPEGGPLRWLWELAV